MALLSRTEQARVVRNLAALISAGFSLKDAFFVLADDYKDVGLIEAEGKLRELIPFTLRKGYLSEVFREMAEEISRGRDESDVLRKSVLFDEDVKQPLASAVESGSLDKMADKLAEGLETEVKMLGTLKKTLISPVMGIVIAGLFTWIMVFRLVPKIASSVTHKDRLPPLVKLAYSLSHHPFLFALGFAGIVALGVLFVKSGVWKPFLPAYKTFERMKFLTWFKILNESGWTEITTLKFLLKSGFSKKWREVIRRAIFKLEAGESLENVMEGFVKAGLLKNSDYSFIKSGIKIGNIAKQIEPALHFLKGETERQIEVTVQMINAGFMALVGSYVAVLYLGIMIPLTTSVQSLM
jgi:type II secretory pathway component PulF